LSNTGVILVAVAIAVGLIGIVVPLLPGVLLVWVAIAVWAIVEHDAASWVTLAVVTALLAITTAIKYLWPMRRMRRADVPSSVLLVGAVLGIIGFFVIPVLGLPIGFVLGIFLAELARLHDQRAASASTVQALKGVALSTLIELSGALLATGVWIVAVTLA
jgi:uncharacterized protein